MDERVRFYRFPTTVSQVEIIAIVTVVCQTRSHLPPHLLKMVQVISVIWTMYTQTNVIPLSLSPRWTVIYNLRRT